MKLLIAAILSLFVLNIAVPAFAQSRSCTTYCTGSGQYRTCTTNCY